MSQRCRSHLTGKKPGGHISASPHPPVTKYTVRIFLACSVSGVFYILSPSHDIKNSMHVRQLGVAQGVTDSGDNGTTARAATYNMAFRSL